LGTKKITEKSSATGFSVSFVRDCRARKALKTFSVREKITVKNVWGTAVFERRRHTNKQIILPRN